MHGVTLCHAEVPTNIDLCHLLRLCSITVVHEISPWYSRVPSFSNPADAPSRGDNEWLAERGSRVTDVGEVAARLIREGQGEAT